MKQLSLLSLGAAFSLAALVPSAASEPPLAPSEKESTATTNNVESSNQDKPRDDKTDREPATDDADDSNASPTTRTYHTFKIDVAYLDLRRVFTNCDEFNHMREELRQEIVRADKDVQQMTDELRRKQDELKDASNDDDARLDREIKNLKQKIEKTKQDKQKEFLEKEARIYEVINDRCRAEVARYAKENDIRAVRQWSPENEREVRGIDIAEISPHNAAQVIKRLNGYVVYQADENVSVTNDITQEIIKRLNPEQRDKSDPPADPAESDASANTEADHKSGIDIAYIDMAYVFKHCDEFYQKRVELKHEIELTQKEITRLVDEIRSRQTDYSKASKSDAPRLYQELRMLTQKTEKMRQEKQKEYVVAEARIYQQTFDHCQAEVARYAKENHIDVVRRWKSNDDRDTRKRDKAETSKHNMTEIQQLLRQDVIYQADDRDPVTNDISKEIVNRMNHNQPDKSASAATTPN